MNISSSIRLVIRKILPYYLRRKLLTLLEEPCNRVAKRNLFDYSPLEHFSDNSLRFQLYLDSLEWAGDSHTDNIYKRLRHVSLYSVIESIISLNVPGDFAECGCWNGCSLHGTATTLDLNNQKRSIHVFDSFDGGLSSFTEEDVKTTTLTDDQIDEISKHFKSDYQLLNSKIKAKSWNNIHLNKGWIPEVFSSYPEHKYSFVHIDVDLYEPTYESRKYFAPRMSCHGIIVCDDYGYSMFPGSTRAVELFLEESRAI